MSVLEKYRKPVKAEFVEKLFVLQLYTIKTCTHFPDKYRTWVTDIIVQNAKQSYFEAFMGNKIRIEDEESYREREKLFEKVVNRLNFMKSEIGIAYECFPFDRRKDAKKDSSEKILVKWMESIDICEKLIQGVIKSDKKLWVTD